MPRTRWTTVNPRALYVLTGLCLIAGLGVILFEPSPSTTLNVLLGGALLGVAVGCVLYMIARFGDPDERGPDF